MRSDISDKVPYLPLRKFTTPNITKNLHLLRNYLRGTEALPVERGDTTATHLHKSKVNHLREALVDTPTVHTGLPLIAAETVIETETGTGIGTVIAIEGWNRAIVAGGTTNLTRTTTADTPLPRVATSEPQKNTDLVAIVKARANESAPRDTETTIITTDPLLAGTDRPARSTTVMMMTKIRENTGNVDTRSGIARGKNMKIYRRDRRASTTRSRYMRKVTTKVMPEVTSRTPQACTVANTYLGMTTTRYPFRIIS